MALVRSLITEADAVYDDPNFPTGNHRSCYLCGELRTEANLAAIGEPACRVCGCRRRAKIDSHTLERTKENIRGLVAEIQQLMQGSDPPEDVGPAFLKRIVHALAAIGASVWRAPRRTWFGRPLPTIEHSVGQTSGREFAAKVMRENKAQIIPQKIGEASFLLIGVPISDYRGLRGALEIVQRPGAEFVTQRGYLRFAQQVVELVPDGSRLFS